MSDHDLLERMQKQMDRIADKMDDVLSVVSDIRANEQITDRRFNEQDREHKHLKEELEELRENSVSKEEFKPIKQAYDWSLKIIITAIVGAVVSLVIYQPTLIKPDHVIDKPKHSQTTEQDK